MLILNKLTRWLVTGVKYTTFVLLAALVVIIFVQVVFRYLLDSSLSWSEELARFLFIWIIMLGASTGIKERYHVAITAFISWLPSVPRRAIWFFVELVCLGVAIFMLLYGMDMAGNVTSQLSPAMRVSMFWVYLAVPVSGGLMLIYLVESLLKAVFGPDAGKEA